MKLKPKSTVHNPRALLYKRFTDLETSIASGRVVLYYTEDEKYWEFSAEMVKFFEFAGDPATIPDERKINVGGITFEKMLFYQGATFIYKIHNDKGSWQINKNITDISQAFAEIDFHFDEESTYIDQTASLSNFLLPESIPNTISYHTDSNFPVLGFYVRIVDQYGNAVVYEATQEGLLTKQDEFFDRENKSIIYVFGELLRIFNIVINAQNCTPVGEPQTTIQTNGSATFEYQSAIGGEYKPPFVINVVGADLLTISNRYGYEINPSSCYISIKDPTENVTISVEFTDDIVKFKSIGEFPVGAFPEITAHFEDYNSHIEREFDIDFDTYNWIDANSQLTYSLEETNPNENVEYSYTGYYRGQSFSSEILSKYQQNGRYYIRSPLGEDQWNFPSNENQFGRKIEAKYIIE